MAENKIFFTPTVGQKSEYPPIKLLPSLYIERFLSRMSNI